MSTPSYADRTPTIPRRRFLGGTLAAASGGTLLTALAGRAADAPAVTNAPPAAPPAFARKLKIGIVGGGHRGNLIGDFMVKHGGYQIHAVVDYFPQVAEAMGKKYGVEPARCFSGLSGYKRALESGLEALAILDVPCFYPQQATDAVAAGCSVYMAKPVAVDVPGTLAIGAAAAEATRRKQAFLVDYQLPLDPANLDVITRVRDGALGPLAHLLSFGKTAAWADPPKGPTIESRLQNTVWLSDVALSGDTIVSYDIHIIDPLVLVTGKRAASACGASRTIRPEPHGDRIDACGVVFEFDDGLLWTHVTQSLGNNADFQDMTASLFGLSATAHLGYSGKVYIRGGPKHVVGEASKSIYNEGAARNVADFYRNVTEGLVDNPTAKRAVDGNLTAILGREAAARHGRLTMDELIRENKKLEVDLTGLKA